MTGRKRGRPRREAPSTEFVQLNRGKYHASNAAFLARLSPLALACWPTIAKQVRDAGALDTLDSSTLVKYCEAYARWLTVGGELAKLLIQLGRSSGKTEETPPIDLPERKPGVVIQQTPSVPTSNRMPNSIMRMREVQAAIGLSRATIYKRVKAGTFPAPVQLGSKSVGWRFGDIEAFLSSPSAYRQPED